jgi:hypothetical protein
MSRGYVGGLERARDIALTFAAVAEGQASTLPASELARALACTATARDLRDLAATIQAEMDNAGTDPRIECCQGCGRPRHSSKYEG